MQGTRSLLIFISFAVVALAGCSDGPPSGDIGASSPAITFDGSFSVEYIHADNGYDIAGTGDGNFDQLCALDAVTEQVNDGAGTEILPTCTPPFTSINVTLHEAPEPSMDGYTLWLTGSEGDDRNVGTLGPGEHGYVLSASYDEDLDGMYATAELRHGELVVATAPANGGTWEVADALNGVRFTGSYDGKDLTLDVSGLPGNATFTGWLVSQDPETLVMTHDVSFPIAADGAIEYAAAENIADYAEVHIHVTGSKINVGIASIN